MTQLGMGVAALNHDSKFVVAYDKGAKKTEYWTYVLEDSLNLIAKLPALAARIYRNTHHPHTSLPLIDKNQDLVGRIGLFTVGCTHRQLTTHVQGTMPTCLGTVATME